MARPRQRVADNTALAAPSKCAERMPVAVVPPRSHRPGGSSRNASIQRSVGTHQRARLDPDVVAEFRYAGPGWQSRINVQLRHTPGFEEAPKRAA